jgi:dihydrofolate synthase
MIDLGLSRVTQLLRHTPQAWRAVHVAGTNGKGSICAYVSAMLHASGRSCGRFTSPHLIDRWDCITVNEQPVSETVFRDAESLVKQRDTDGRVGATEFELLTATAFEIFHREKIEYGVVEVGMGGRLDATNAMHHKDVAIVAKIGLDHQAFLGNTLEEIALQKAGIMCKGVKVVVDPSNTPSVLKVLEDHANEVGVEMFVHANKVDLDGYEPHQLQNIAVAHMAYRLATGEADVPLTHYLPALRQINWPGRLQKLDISRVTGRQAPILLDGAHNTQSAEVLATYVQNHLRTPDKRVTWVLAATQGKDMKGILQLLLWPGDNVAAVRFEPVDGMPWVQPADPLDLLKLASQEGIAEKQLHNSGDDVKDALTWASSVAGAAEPVVVAGSLYLVSSVLRLLRNTNSH